ncbi:hypothetical protein ACWEWI_32415 [Streptomyces sp. NPDC003753]
MTALIQDAALALLAPGFVCATVAAVRYRRTAHSHATDKTELEEVLQRAQSLSALRDQEIQHLATHRLPAVAGELWGGSGGDAGQPLHPELAGTAFAQAEKEILQYFGTLAEQASTRAERAAQAAVQSVTRALQALVYEQQRAISSMIDHHDDEKVLADAYEIDHACSQLARKAQIVGLLAGAWPGRQRDDTPLLDVVRGAESRIKDYRRVRITGEPTEYVGSTVVEPVVLAVAELLDNAARNSQPGTTVEVYFVHAHNGVSIVIDDAGIGLTPETRADAARLLTGKEPVRLTQLRNLRMRRQLEREAPERLKLRMWGYPYLSWVTLAGILVVVSSMLLVPDARSQLYLSVLSLAVILATYVAVRYVQRTAARR